jgi:hypothetical protein
MQRLPRLLRHLQANRRAQFKALCGRNPDTFPLVFDYDHGPICSLTSQLFSLSHYTIRGKMTLSRTTHNFLPAEALVAGYE